MLWRGRRVSGNVEDRRGMSGKGMLAGGGLLGVVIYLVVAFLGGDPSSLQQLPAQQRELSSEEKAAEDTLAQFAGVVLAETEEVWNELLSAKGIQYQQPRMVLFRDYVQSGCGNASAASGPFYCPADGKLYLDLSFYDQLRNRFKANGDFAMAYVIAHEVGHHIQNLMGTTDKLQQLRQQLNETEYNQMSVRLELQADYYAGVWAHYADKENNIIEPGDIEEALRAASAVGDDNIQKQSQGYIVPDAFTHGTSEQRMHWFSKGYRYGDLEHGNTFESNELSFNN